MKEQKYSPLTYLGLTLSGGLLGFFLRLLMLNAGYDETGVLIRGHWTYTALWILSILFIAALTYVCLGMGSRKEIEENFPPSLPAAAGTILGAGCLFLVSLMGLLEDGVTMDRLTYGLGIGASMALAYEGLLRKDGKSSLWPCMAVSVFAALYLIAKFRLWSNDPLLGDYCFRVIACVAAMLAAFQLCSFSIGRGKRRASLFWTGACVFFCMMSLADGGLERIAYFGGMTVWQLLACCTPAKPRGPRRVLGGGTEEAPSEETPAEAEPGKEEA